MAELFTQVVRELNEAYETIDQKLIDSQSAASSASTQAALAATKASEAASSAATAASASALATQKALEANNSANQATTKANEALNSANNASTQAATATAQATIATTKASEAAASSTTASEQATIATTKASEAAASATTASEQAAIAATKADEAENARVASLLAVGEAQTIKDSIWNLNVPIKFVLGADYEATRIVINPHDLLAYIANTDITDASDYPHNDTTNWDLYTIGVADVNGSVITVRLKMGSLAQLTGTTLAQGEMAYEIDGGKLKAGNGVNLYQDLPYVGQNAVSWGDIAGKPTEYTPTEHNHDDRYYTETELNNGQLDSRYYTETEVDTGIAVSIRRNLAYSFVN